MAEKEERVTCDEFIAAILNKVRDSYRSKLSTDGKTRKKNTRSELSTDGKKRKRKTTSSSKSSSSPPKLSEEALFHSGMVSGKLRWSEEDSEFDCEALVSGTPPNIDGIKMTSDAALFILLVEKVPIFHRLAEGRFYNRFPCILICSGGHHPNVSTGLFLKKMHTELRLPVLALTDSTPRAFKSLLFYGSGSENMYGRSDQNLITPAIRWLGLRPTDSEMLDLGRGCRFPMTKKDIKTAQDMLKDDIVKRNSNWVRELEMMMTDQKHKVEIEALGSFGYTYLTDVYLPLKLQEQDWL